MSKAISPRSAGNLKREPQGVSQPRNAPQELAPLPVCGALCELENRCAALESVADRLEERLHPVLYPGQTGLGSDGNEPNPVVSPVVESINRSANRLAVLYDRLESLIGRLEC